MNDKIVVRAFLIVLVIVAILVCHLSFRLRYASENYSGFNTDQANATFSDLVRYATYRNTPPSGESCYNKLRQIDGAKQLWASQNNKQSSDTPSLSDIMPYLSSPAP